MDSLSGVGEGRPSNRSGRLYRLSAVVACWIALVGGTSCSSDFRDTCSDRDPCAPGYSCVGFFFTACERACERDEDCAAKDFCARGELFASGPYCKEGCRSDDQCGKGDICAAGACQEGCREDAQCAPGLVCKGVIQGFMSPDNGPPACKPGCRDDSECARGEACVCDACEPNGCNSSADCAEGSYCDGGLSVFACGVGHCLDLPEPITCGTGTCPAAPLELVLGSALLPACCLSDAPNACGVDLNLLAAASTETTSCRAIGAPGASDPTCVDKKFLDLTVAPGCRRTDGRCGYLLDAREVGDGALGCVLPF